MFGSWFGSKKATKPREDIPEKISQYSKRLTQENMGLVEKKATLQMMISSQGRSVLQTPVALRLICAMKRHKSMMKVYQTSLTALESTQQNLEMQQVTADVQQLIGRAGHANVEDVEESMLDMEEMNAERQQLAQLLGTINEEDDEDFLNELNLEFPEDIKVAPRPQAAEMKFPSPPQYIPSVAIPTSSNSSPKPPNGAVAELAEPNANAPLNATF